MQKVQLKRAIQLQIPEKTILRPGIHNLTDQVFSHWSIQGLIASKDILVINDGTNKPDPPKLRNLPIPNRVVVKEVIPLSPPKPIVVEILPVVPPVVEEVKPPSQPEPPPIQELKEGVDIERKPKEEKVEEKPKVKRKRKI